MTEAQVTELKKKLFQEAEQRYPGESHESKHQRAYVFGTLRKLGWKPEREKWHA